MAKDVAKAAEEGVELVYKHYGDNIAKYFSGALRHLRNSLRGAPTATDRLAVPKRILPENIRLGTHKHDYAFWKDKKSGQTILEVSEDILHPKRAGEKAAAKQMLQELVGTTDDFGLRGLSSREKELFPKKFLASGTQESSAKDVYSRIMSYKAEAGIPSSFEQLTEAEAKKIFDIGWDANMFYPTTSSNALQTKETFWKENKSDILRLFRRVPAILGAGIVGEAITSERKGGVINYAQLGMKIPKFQKPAGVIMNKETTT